jgi:hypothetical protein
MSASSDFLLGALGKLGRGGLWLDVLRRMTSATCPSTGICVSVGSALGVATVNGERAAFAAWFDDCLPGERFLRSRHQRQLTVRHLRVTTVCERFWWHVHHQR